MSCSILDLPVELLEACIAYLDRPEDLVAFSSTCHLARSLRAHTVHMQGLNSNDSREQFLVQTKPRNVIMVECTLPATLPTNQWAWRLAQLVIPFTDHCTAH